MEPLITGLAALVCLSVGAKRNECARPKNREKQFFFDCFYFQAPGAIINSPNIKNA
jgi:hypothetical protein